MSLFQASQQWSTMSSKDLKIRFESQLSHMNCQTFSCGFSSGHFCRQWDERDVGRNDQAARRDASRPDQRAARRARPARSGWRFRPGACSWLRCHTEASKTGIRPLANPCRADWRRIYKRRRFADLWERSDAFHRLAQRRVILFFWPMRASSANQTSMASGAMPFSRLISSRRSGRLFKVLNCAFRLGVMARASRELAIIHLAQHAAQRLLGDDDAEFLENPLAEIDDPPTHDP